MKRRKLEYTTSRHSGFIFRYRDGPSAAMLSEAYRLVPRLDPGKGQARGWISGPPSAAAWPT
ncbi:hypothetical protein BC937DRAFT_89341 [Endogone sp. FLAS-F59071]|nr:hypothetical protein BC937DRAFT_89341 [Endogone sp. FLAS-F59071]|eukprot:RUS17929.1 hypothetical protein BC937DRAFT_89341 [Endogone sp. FLAS-F59071]